MPNPTNKLTHEEVTKRLLERNVALVGVYIDKDTAILVMCITCRRKWNVRPGNIFNGHGCPDCGRIKIGNARRLTSDELQDRLRKLEDRGIAMISGYTNRRSKGLFQCKYGHEWNATVGNVFSGRGCWECGRAKAAERSRAKKLSESELRQRCAALTERGITIVGRYISTNEKIRFRCAKDHEWSVEPYRVFAGSGCSICANAENGKRQRLSKSELHNRCLKIARRGLTMIEDFVTIHTKTRFRHECGYEWNCTPITIFRGGGCPRCANHGFQSDKPAILYYVKLRSPFGEEIYKIGVTNQRNIKERFGREFSRITIIETWYFENGAEAFEMEQDILNDYDADRYDGPDILKTGNDELFNFDVLGLDTRRKGQLELVA